MREELAHRNGRRGEFRAVLKRTGGKRNSHGYYVKTALFVDVRDEANTLVADHLWFNWGKQMDGLKLQPGDRVRFTATVATYHKLNRDRDWDDDESRYVVDYRLMFPRSMRVLGRDAESLPLFDQAVMEAS